MQKKILNKPLSDQEKNVSHGHKLEHDVGLGWGGREQKILCSQS